MKSKMYEIKLYMKLNKTIVLKKSKKLKIFKIENSIKFYFLWKWINEIKKYMELKIYGVWQSMKFTYL